MIFEQNNDLRTFKYGYPRRFTNRYEYSPNEVSRRQLAYLKLANA